MSTVNLQRVVENQPAPGAGTRYRLLEIAFQRPCMICKRSGLCRHREPEVELAYLLYGLDRKPLDSAP